MHLPRPARNQLIAANLFLVLSAVVFPAGCKHSVSPPHQPQSSATAGGAQQSGASPVSSSGDQPGSLADRLKAVQNPDAAAAAPLPDWKPVSSAASIEIPLVEGLVVDSTISSTSGDLDDIETTRNIDATTITKEGDNERPPKTPGSHPPDLNAPSETVGKGTVLIDVADVASSNHLFPYFAVDKTLHNPGALDRGVSTETLKQLRAGKTVDFHVATDAASMLFATFKGNTQPTTQQWGAIPVYQCNLQQAEPKDVALPVLVNNEPVELPALHAKCLLDNNEENHFYILDQLSNPIFLYTRLGTHGSSSQTIKITFPVANTQNSLEQKLADKQPVEIYGIYFDFNSAHIKPESEAVLKQISDILHKNPGWKLSVSGHTDNIGGDDFNLKLSQARAEAVKTALVKEYKIAPDRLTTSGFGASRPVADNSKAEGRARNRRVELQRQ